MHKGTSSYLASAVQRDIKMNGYTCREIISAIFNFILPVPVYRKSSWTKTGFCISIDSDGSGGVGISKMLFKFYVQVFYVMVKVLTCELSSKETGIVVSLY